MRRIGIKVSSGLLDFFLDSETRMLYDCAARIVPSCQV